jgi:hypothetical protein
MPRDEPELGMPLAPLVEDPDFDGADEDVDDRETFDPSPKNGVPELDEDGADGAEGDDPGAVPRGPRPS